jgi:hypothetical protein
MIPCAISSFPSSRYQKKTSFAFQLSPEVDYLLGVSTDLPETPIPVLLAHTIFLGLEGFEKPFFLLISAKYSSLTVYDDVGFCTGPTKSSKCEP